MRGLPAGPGGPLRKSNGRSPASLGADIEEIDALLAASRGVWGYCDFAATPRAFFLPQIWTGRRASRTGMLRVDDETIGCSSCVGRW